jgi:hypothetical protein
LAVARINVAKWSEVGAINKTFACETEAHLAQSVKDHNKLFYKPLVGLSSRLFINYGAV